MKITSKQLYDCERLIKKKALKRFSDISEDQSVSIKQELLDSYPNELLFEFNLMCVHTCEPLTRSSIYLTLDTQCSKEHYYLSVYGLGTEQISFKIGDEPFVDQLHDCLDYLFERLAHSS